MHLLSSTSWIFWDPPRDAFTIPYFNLAIAWYGIIFASGFVIGYLLLLPMLKKELSDGSLQANFKSRAHSPERKQEIQQFASQFADSVTWFIVIGTIIGARLGHVFFYEWPYYSAHPMEILMIRNGGLASHGGTLGVILALFFFLKWNRKEFPSLTFVKLIDILVVPTAVAVCFIRIANFFNQEILGNLTDLPWGVIFGHAADGSAPAPRHPVQLYEAFAYLATFFILHFIWKKYSMTLKPGILSGLFFIFVFGSRFLIEYLKEPQSPIDAVGMHMGQYLSIPFILLGAALLAWPNNKRQRT